jgi:ubiquinol-cytochrome c reductase cytochrome c subunit
MTRRLPEGARRRAATVLLPVALSLGAAAAVMAWWSTTASASSVSGAASRKPSAPADQVAAGRALFLTSCSSCHAADGHGVTTSDGSVRGPSVVHSGEAGAYYWLSTGRMPLTDSSKQAERKPPAFDQTGIDALVAYVASLGSGPKLPHIAVANANLAQGGEIFRANCAPCHSAAGSGGALSYGADAPSLSQATALQVGAAVRSGPGQMPVFGPKSLSAGQVNDVSDYVQYLRSPDDRGGIPIGRTGPVPEGFVAWTLGIGALLAAVGWIGTRAPARQSIEPGAPDEH